MQHFADNTLARFKPKEPICNALFSQLIETLRPEEGPSMCCDYRRFPLAALKAVRVIFMDL